jgi:PAS domain S-box-containing protein
MIPPDDTSGSSERAPVLSFVVRRDGSLLHAHRLLPDVQVLASPGASIFDYVARPYHARVRTVLERVFSGVAERCLCRGAPPAAEQTWFQCFARPNREEGAKPIQTATFIACDVTEMKQVEDQLRQERDRLQHELVGATREISTYRDSDPGVQRFRAIMEQAGDAIFVTDAVAEQIVDLNETACHWLGSARTDVIQRRVDDVRAGFPLIPPEAAAARFTETRRIPRPWVSDRGTVRRKDGTTFAVESVRAVARRDLPVHSGRHDHGGQRGRRHAVRLRAGGVQRPRQPQAVPTARRHPSVPGGRTVPVHSRPAGGAAHQGGPPNRRIPDHHHTPR